MLRRHLRTVAALTAALAILGPLAFLWWTSRIPDTYSAMEMGYVDLGGDPGATEHADMAHAQDAVDLSTLTGPRTGEPDVATTLTARRDDVAIVDGPTVQGYTLNGSSPGPEIRATVGDLVEVRLVNESVPDGVSLHWHGVDVPAAEDGVAGVTQDAVAPGGSHVYRFVAEDAGTYWYHSHQVSHEQVRDGLWGSLVVEPAEPTADVDVVAAVHTYDGTDTINGQARDMQVDAAAGSTARVRLINTDASPFRAWVAGAAYRVAAIDGRDLHAPTEVSDAAVTVTAGGRVDLELTMPADGKGVRVSIDGSQAAVLLGADGTQPPEGEAPTDEVDFLSYGAPADIGFDTSDPDRRFDYRIGRRPGFLDGRPGLWWTINGHLYPDVPMYTVAEGDVVVMTIANTSGQVHPMHLHGHHAVVLSRDGEPATGSPWWVDSLDVGDGETYDIAFLADNPGIWMDHCHNLTHAADGMVGHLMYEGVRGSYRIGGAAGNEPE